MSVDADYIMSIFPEIHEINDEKLRQAVLNIWVEGCDDSGVEDLRKIPKNLDNIGYFLVNHTKVVTKSCKNTAQLIKELHHIEVNMDLLLAGALLHDVSKLMEITADGNDFLTSEFGEKVQHGFYAAYKAYEKRLPLDLQHMLIAHTPKSNIMPKTIEAVILYYVDGMDTEILNYSLGIPLKPKC
jgi:hypothetical protein